MLLDCQLDSLLEDDIMCFFKMHKGFQATYSQYNTEDDVWDQVLTLFNKLIDEEA